MRANSSNTGIANVDNARGFIYGVNAGQTTVKIGTYNGKTKYNKKVAQITVTVRPGAEWVALNYPVLTLTEGESFDVNAEYSTGALTTITYSSSDPGIASVTGSGARGTVKAVSAGTATITAVSDNGVFDTCSVTVLPAPEEVSFAEGSLVISEGETADLPGVAVTSSRGTCS